MTLFAVRFARRASTIVSPQQLIPKEVANLAEDEKSVENVEEHESFTYEGKGGCGCERIKKESDGERGRENERSHIAGKVDLGQMKESQGIQGQISTRYFCGWEMRVCHPNTASICLLDPLVSSP